MTLVAFGCCSFSDRNQQSLRHYSAISAAPQISGAKITRNHRGLTESLGGVRVVKGYHAEEREEKVFASGVQRLLDNVLNPNRGLH